MISHKFREVMQFADEVTVLRRGRLAGRGRVADLDARRDGADDGGRRAAAARPARARRARAATSCCAIDALDARDDDLGMPALSRAAPRACARARSSASPACRATARRSWSRCWPASASARGGQVHVDGQRLPARRAREMRALKVRCLPEEPLRNACVGTMSVAENIGFRRFDRPPFTLGGALVSARRAAPGTPAR